MRRHAPPIPFRCRCEDLWHSCFFFFFPPLSMAPRRDPCPWKLLCSQSLSRHGGRGRRYLRRLSTSTERTIQGRINNKNIQSCFNMCICGLFLSLCPSKCLFFFLAFRLCLLQVECFLWVYFKRLPDEQPVESFQNLECGWTNPPLSRRRLLMAIAPCESDG